MPYRQNALNKWLEQLPGVTPFTITPLAGDASFRRYYRMKSRETSYIVMDAPPEKETMRPFIAVAELLRSNDIRTPKIIACDEASGFALLEDFGDGLLLNKLTPATADDLYQSAIDTLIHMQQCPTSSTYPLPCFDTSFILGELGVFKQWFLQTYLKLQLSEQEEQLLEQTFNWLASNVSNQPGVFIHRDFHSRNIMMTEGTPDTRPAIIDFQDAMQGPFTYDLVSLLKDCYIQWPRDDVMRWLSYFHEQSLTTRQWSLPAFIRAFDLCGLQRHLKVLGVFARLSLRDNKHHYLKDLPLTLHYVLATLEDCEELQPFYQFMQQRVRLP